MPNVLVDVQSLFTAESKRGIGRALQLWLDGIEGSFPDLHIHKLRHHEGHWWIDPGTGNWVRYPDLASGLYANAIDLLHLTSTMMPTIVLPSLPVAARLAITVHDLIPLAMRESYLDRWPAGAVRDYLDRLRYLEAADLILTDSDATGRDVRKALPGFEGQLRTVYVASRRMPPAADPPIGEPYVFTVAGDDLRKNTAGLIEAFAQLDAPGTFLAIAGLRSEEHLSQARGAAERLKIAHRVRLLPPLSEAELASWYSGARIVCEPSLYEGFGMPALEAISFAKRVAAFGNSSLPEVCGAFGHFASDLTPRALADAMAAALSCADEPMVGLDDWLSRYRAENTASALAEAYRACLAAPFKLPPIAIHTPVPPAVSGIADFNQTFLPFLQELADVRVVSQYPILPELETSVPIYHMGNNTLHLEMFEEMRARPGITVLHEAGLWGFFTQCYFARGRVKEFERFLAEDGVVGVAARKLTSLLAAGAPIDSPPAMLGPILVRSKFVVTHNAYAFRAAGLADGRGAIVRLLAEPLLALETPPARELEIVVPGGIWPNKRHEVAIRAFHKVHLALQDARMRIVGTGDVELERSLRAQVQDLGLEEAVIFEGYASRERYEACLGGATVALCLRYPTMGETSGAVLDALRHGVPVIVNQVGSYTENPRESVWPVPVAGTESEVDLIATLCLEILNNPRVFGTMSASCRQAIAELHDPRKIARQELAAVRQLLAIEDSRSPSGALASRQPIF